MKIKESNFVSNILNGLSIGIVITLIPSAILGSLMRIFGNDPAALAITQMTSVSQSLLAVVSAYAIAHFFKFSSIDSGSLMLAAFAGSGAYTFSKGTVILSGPGDIINIGLTIALSSLLIFLLKDRLGQLKVIFSPILVLSLGGGIGRLIFPFVHSITTEIGRLINDLTGLQPLIMGPLMGAIFAVLILSPISSAGIALAIGLSGIGSGAANLGITTASFALALMGSSVNSFGGIISHFIGTPKIQMANMLKKPRLFLPIIIVSALAGLEAALLNIQGTPMSAGFGFSGLIGPIAAFSTGTKNLMTIIFAFVVIPVILALLTHFIFVKRTSFVSPSDLKLPDQD